ncbi:YhjD/YihY/BrkB family envelope integrity protein [Yinghuangia aomiensis]
MSLFPLIALAAAVVAAALSPGRVTELQDKISDQIPGIADKIDLNALVNNAGAVGVIGAVLLLVSGLGWVEALRPAIRKMWFEDEPEARGRQGDGDHQAQGTPERSSASAWRWRCRWARPPSRPASSAGSPTRSA